MAEVIPIDDPSDLRLDDYRDLRDPEGRRRSEAAAGIFVAEGITVLGRLLASRFRVRSVLVLESKLDRVLPLVTELDVPVYSAPRDVLTTVAGFDLHRGIVAIGERGAPSLLDDVLDNTRTVVVLEGLNDPENLGAIARAARALHADALVLDPTCADHLARRTIRVSMGEILFIPVVRLESLSTGLATLRARGFDVAALTPAPDSISLFDWTPPERVAVMFGAEGPGLSAAALAAADRRVRIPIRSDVDSLNVGHAAAVTLTSLAARGHSSTDQ